MPDANTKSGSETSRVRVKVTGKAADEGTLPALPHVRNGLHRVLHSGGGKVFGNSRVVRGGCEKYI